MKCFLISSSCTVWVLYEIYWNFIRNFIIGFHLAVYIMWAWDEPDFVNDITFFSPFKQSLSFISVKYHKKTGESSQESKVKTALNCSGTLKSNQQWECWQHFRKGISGALNPVPEWGWARFGLDLGLWPRKEKGDHFHHTVSAGSTQLLIEHPRLLPVLQRPRHTEHGLCHWHASQLLLTLLEIFILLGLLFFSCHICLPSLGNINFNKIIIT